MGVFDKFKKNYNTVVLITYLLPILVSMIVSLVHVISFWNIMNPMGWAMFLSVAIEIGVLSSLAASRISNMAWLPFTIVTFIQIIGNIFYSYVHTNVGDFLFKQWVEMVDPFFNFMGLGTDGDPLVHKRIVSMFGAFVPIIAMVFFNFFIRQVRKTQNVETVAQPTVPVVNVEPQMIPIEPEITAEEVKSEPEPIIEPQIAPVEPEVTAEAVKNEPPDWYKNIDFAKIDELPPEVWKEIAEEVQKPTPASEAIENMTKIDPEKLNVPYMAPTPDITEEMITAEPLPEIASDYTAPPAEPEKKK